MIQPDSATWTARVLTLYPEMFPGFLGMSLAGRALKSQIWTLHVVDVRDYASDRHRTVDATPYGGGPGMVMRPDIIAACLERATPAQGRIICPSPRGTRVDQGLICDLAATPDVTFLCGRFEGIDQRVLDARRIEEVSLGDFILSGGEAAALAMMDAVVRLLPGVIGTHQSVEDESFSDGLLEYPQYTRPPVWEGHAVPEVLLSGNHAHINAWRRAAAEQVTKNRRPDLWMRYEAERANR